MPRPYARIVGSADIVYEGNGGAEPLVEVRKHE